MTDAEHDALVPPAQDHYPSFVGDGPEAHRRWDYSVAVAAKHVVEDPRDAAGIHMAAMVLYKSELPTT
jgi:hypothetical protein